MSTSGISSSSFSNQSIQEFQEDFQQLGQDLQSGNLSAAQQDFVTLQQVASQSSSTSSTQSSPLATAFNQLAKDLQSSNLSAAQQDFKQIQQDFQSQAQSTQGQHHHHHSGGSESSQVSQLLDQLGTALQSGNLSSAQQLFSTLQQDFQQLGQSTTQESPDQTSNAVTVSITA